MSKLAALDGLLELYYQLNYHKNPEIYQRLQDVQAWQKLRMQRTHARHFAEKQNALMAEYFLNRLYGGPDFDALAQQIARLNKYAHKAEKLIPENAIKTGTSGVSLAILAVQLDEQVAMQLLQDYHPHEALTDEMMRQTYLKLNQGQGRLQQLELLDLLGKSLLIGEEPIVLTHFEYTILEYLMRNVGGQWKIFDVMIEGISYVQTFKNQFDAPLRQKSIKQVATELRSGSMQANAGPAAPRGK